MISEEKGRGLVTNRDVKIGQVVLEEAPLLFIKRSKSSRDSGQTRAEDVIQYQIEVLKCYERLDGRSKEKFNELHYIAKKGGTNNKTLNIWFSNCLAIQLHDEEDEDRGLFSLFSKTNHSCEPNCVINFTEERKLKLVAVQPIQRGGEVLVSYLHSHGGWDNLLDWRGRPLSGKYSSSLAAAGFVPSLARSWPAMSDSSLNCGEC